MFPRYCNFRNLLLKDDLLKDDEKGLKQHTDRQFNESKTIHKNCSPP
jgi:hypothetical protein